MVPWRHRSSGRRCGLGLEDRRFALADFAEAFGIAELEHDPIGGMGEGGDFALAMILL